MAIETLGAPLSASNLEILVSAAASRAWAAAWQYADRGVPSAQRRIRNWARTKMNLLRLGELPAGEVTKECCAESPIIDILPRFLDFLCKDGYETLKGCRVA